MEHLEGIAEADARLGRPFPLPTAPLPLVRWVEVRIVGEGAEVEWNLDDSRPGAPGRLALYAGVKAAPEQLTPAATATASPEGWLVRSEPLEQAQDSLRPVVEVSWLSGDLHLRLTAQGPWEREAVLTVARSVPTG